MTAGHLFVLWRKRKRPQMDSNPQSSDPNSGALFIRPRGQSHESVQTIFRFEFGLSCKFIQTKRRGFTRLRQAVNLPRVVWSHYIKNFRQKIARKSAWLPCICLFYGQKESDHEGTRTLNLPIRSRTPYPLGHAANHIKAWKQVFALSLDSLSNLLKPKGEGLRGWVRQ